MLVESIETYFFVKLAYIGNMLESIKSLYAYFRAAVNVMLLLHICEKVRRIWNRLKRLGNATASEAYVAITLHDRLVGDRAVLQLRKLSMLLRFRGFLSDFRYVVRSQVDSQMFKSSINGSYTNFFSITTGIKRN